MELKDLAERVKSYLPSHAEVNTSVYYNSPAIEIKCSPSMSESDFDDAKKKMLAEINEFIGEIYTEETGHHFFVYPKKVEEAETSDYEPPKYAIKPYPGDTGFALVRKHYHRFIWTWNKYANKQLVENLNEDGEYRNTRYLGEIPGMGSGDSSITPGAVGYDKGPLSQDDMVPTDAFEDPDKKKKEKREHIKKIKDFKSFNDHMKEISGGTSK